MSKRNDKPLVSMEQHCCVVCGKEFDTGAVLLATKFDRNGNPLAKFGEGMHTLTGYGLCPDDQKMHDEGYIALIGVDESRSVFESDGNLKVDQAYRTGHVAHLKREVWNKLFDLPCPDSPFVFCETDLIEKLKAMQAKAESQPQSQENPEGV